MLEIKSYDDWTQEEEELTEDPVSNIKKYTDYVRLNYSKAGILNPETDSEIVAGVQDRLNEEVFTEDMTEEDRNGIFSSVVGPDKSDDADARFVLDYLKAEGQQDDARVQNLTQYLSMKELAPDRAEEFRQPVADIIGDRKLVRDSRISAADRGDYSVVAIEEDNGDRTFYSGPSAKPEKVFGEVDSLIKAGAIATSDLSSISNYVKPINGGLSNTSEATRYDIFRRTVGEKAKADQELGGLLQNQAGVLRQQKEEEQRTTGEAVLEGAKTAIAYPFVKLGDAVMAAGSFLTGEEKPEPKYAPDTKLSDVLGSDENLRKKFSAEEIEKFSDAMVTDAAGAVFRADKPETGITMDSMGNPIIASALLPKDDLFEKALAAAPLNEDQQKMARVRRDQLLETTAPELLKVILEEEPDAVGMLAKAKADGLSDAEFVKSYVSDSKNYSGFETRLEQFGKSAWKTVAEIPLGLAALSGNEWAAKEMVKMNKDQSRRQEFSRMFGDEYGIGFQLLNTIPQVATDIGLTIGTGGVFAGAKTLAKAGSVSSKTALRTMAKLGLSNVDDVAAQSFRAASTTGGEATTSNAIKEMGRSLATQFAENAPVFTTSFVRSATSTYGSLYGQLPDDMSHEEKHKNALNYSLAAGLSTGIITTGMSFLGRGGVEEVATKRIRAMLGGETDEAVAAAGGRVVPVDKLNYRQAKAVYENFKNESAVVTDRAFQRAMRGALGGAYKNYMRTTFGGIVNEATEEMIDQAIQMKLEDAALDQETPLSEKVNQIFTAGVIGGGLGGITAGATQFGPIKKSELALVYEARASALDKVATQLRKTNSNATAETVQRMIDDARTRATEATQAETQARIQEEKNDALATKKPIFADPAEKQLPDEREEMVELAMLGDLVGESVSAAGFSGTLESDDKGSVFLKTKDGETLHLGSRYEKAEGRISSFPKLMTTAKDEGKVPAGTPYIVRGKKESTKIAMPAVSDTNRPEDFLGVIKDEEGNVKQLVVRGATLMSNQDFGMDIKISNGYQMKSLARYYNADLDTLQDLTPPPAEGESINAVDIDKIEEAAISDEAKQSIITAKDVLQYGPNQNLYKSFMAGDSSKAKFKQTVLNLSPDELNSVAQTANTFFDWVTSDDTIPTETKGVLLQSAEDLKNRVALAFKLQADQAEQASLAGQSDLTDEEKAAIDEELQGALKGGDEEVTTPKGTLTPEEQEAENKRLKGVITGAPKEPTATKSRKTPEGNVVLEGPSPQEQLRALMKEYSDVHLTARLVEIDGKYGTLQQAAAYRDKLVYLKNLYTEDAAVEEATARLSALDKSITKAKRAISSRRLRLRKKMSDLAPSPEGFEETTLTQSEQDLANRLAAIEGTRPIKPVEVKAVKPQRIKHEKAGEDWSTEDKLNLFRNEGEEKAFNELVNSGLNVTDLNGWGLSVAGKVQEALGFGDVPLFTKKRFLGDPTNPNKYVKGKNILLRRKVLEQFPIVETDTGFTPVPTKKKYANSQTGKFEPLKIPVFRDKNLDVVSGAFTNDTHITRAQIDQNIETFVPKEIIDKHNDPKSPFRINPSIDFDRATGKIMSVLDPVTLEPVRFSGQSYHTTMANYAPLRGKMMMSLVSAMIPPTASRLVNAGPTATGRQSIEGRGLSAKEYIEDFKTYLGGQYKDEEGNIVRNIGRGYSALKDTFQLDDNSIADLSSYALADYAFQVYEFAIGTELKKSLINALNFDGNKALTKKLEMAAETEGLVPPTVVPEERIEFIRNRLSTEKLFELAGVTSKTLRDINPVKVVSKFFYTNNIPSIASAITNIYPQFSGGSGPAVIAKYAESLFDRITSPKGDLYTGPKKAQTVLGYYGDLYQRKEISANVQAEQYRDFGPENVAALDTLVFTGKLNDSAIDPLFMSTRTTYEDNTDAFIEFGDSLRRELISAVNNTPTLEAALQDTASLFSEGLSELKGARLVDALNNLVSNLGGDNRHIAIGIVQRLYRGEFESGLRAAGIMAELGWLPPVANFNAVPPDTEAPDTLESPTASRERLAKIIQDSKEKAYRSVGSTTPQEEAEYRRTIAQAVELVQPEVLAASARAEELQRKAELRSRYATSLDSLVNVFTTQKGADKFNAVVSKLNSDISGAQDKISRIDTQLEELGVELEVARGRAEKAQSAQKTPTTKRTKKTARKDLVSPAEFVDMAISNLKYLQRSENKLRREQEVLTKFIERMSPVASALDSPQKLDSVFAAINSALNKARQESTHYTKASEQSILKAQNLVKDAASVSPYKIVAEQAAVATRRLRENRSMFYPAANDVNSEAEMQAARTKNAEDMLRYGLFSNDPESVLDALQIISKSNVESHRDVANLLLLAPDFIRSVRFRTVDLRSDWAGLYDSETNTVLVNLAGHNGRGLADVLLHEYLHAATVTYFNNPRNAQQRAAVARINQLRELALAQASKNGMIRFAHVRRGLANNAEFLTYTLTAPEFQASLATLTPTGQRSLISRLIDAILSFFGKENTLLNKSVKELLDFSQMALVNFHTFNIDSARDYDALSEVAQDIKARAEDLDYFDNVVEDIITRYEGGQDGVFYLAENEADQVPPLYEVYDRETGEVVWTGIRRDIARQVQDRRDNAYGGYRFAVRQANQMKPFTLIATPEEIDNQVKFTPEERQRFINFSRAYSKALDLDVSAIADRIAGEPDSSTISDSDINNFLDSLSRLDEPTRFSNAAILSAWPKEVSSLLRRSGIDEVNLNKQLDNITKLGKKSGWWKSADNGQFYRFAQATYFFYEGRKPLRDIYKNEKGDAESLEGAVSDTKEDFGYAIGQLYWYLIDLIEDGGAKKYFVSPDLAEQLKVASRRMLMAYAEAFAPENEIEIARSWVRSVIRDKGEAKPAGDYTHYARIASEASGPPPINVLEEIKRIVPDGVSVEIDNTMSGAMGVRRSKPNTIFVNQRYISTLGYGLSEANAKAVVRTAVDEELAHIAANSVFTNDDYLAIAKELGPDMVNRILDITYSNMEPDDAARAALIAADREAGITGDLDAAAEWVRMEMTRMATGRTREVDIAFFYTNPSLLERFLEGLKVFITKLKQQFKSTPTAGTAARISQASRSFRKLRNGGVLPTPEPSAANEYGDTTAFLNAINGDLAEGQEDRTSFMLPVAGTGASKQKTKDFWKMTQDKMYNLPMELRKYLSMRDGTISQIEYTIEDFDRRFPKMRDEALARGASIEDIGMILGTTAPVVQGEARKEIQRKVREFKKDNATDPDLERKAEDYESQLTQPEADKFFAAFRKEQQAMESRLKSAGFGDLVDYLVEFRGEINKYKAVINFDESNDVYLTRTFRFFGSEGWASFAKMGGVAMIDGKEVDFNKLRAAAAKHFEWEVDNDAKQNGQTLTAEQRDKKLIEALDKYLENLELEAADAKDLGAMNTVRKDVNRLLRKKDFDAPLRTLLGEVTDPFENAVRTVYSVGRLAANERFLRNFASKAIEIEVASRTRKPDMELLFPPSQSAQLGDLAGLYVRKDIAATIREELGMNGMKQQSKATEQMNKLGRFISKFSGLSITAKTLGSIGFYPRNILGGVALTTAQGIVNPVYLKEAMRLSIIANMSLNGRIKAESEESRNQIRRLVELQILKDETRGRIAMDMLNGFVNSTDQQLEELLDDIVEAQGSGNIEKIIKKFKLKGTWEATKQAGGSTVEFLASLNNVIDSAFKLNAYFFELSALKEAYGDTESESKLEVDAARKVKLTFPTHSDQVSFAKAFNKSPFSMVVLPFVRWKSEVFRTMFNTIPLAVEEMKSGNPVMRSRGTKRLIGFTSTVLGGGAAYGALFSTLFALLTDDEDDERDGIRKLNDEELDALREGLPKWQRNHGIFAQLLQDGSVQVIDMSNILPASQLTDMVGLAARGNLKGMADYLTSEMIGTQIAASTVLELAQNRDEFDQPIWLGTDNAVGAFGKMLFHLGKGSLLPSVVDKVVKIGRYGEQNAKEMIVGELTGVRPMIHKTTDIEYRGMRNLKESADAVVSLLYPLSSGKGLNPDKVEGLIDDHQSASNKNQEQLHNFLMGMKSIGSTEASLATTAKQMKFSKQRFGAALEGVNIPWVPNEQWFRKMIDNKMRVGEQNPDEIANEINRVLTQKADVYSTNFLE